MFLAFMLETLLVDTKDVLERAERVTGLKIKLLPNEVDYDSSAGLTAYLRQPGNEAVTISYNPGAGSVNHAIAHSAVRIMRYRAAPPSERYLLSSGGENRAFAYAQMEQELDRLPVDVKAVSKIGFSMFYNGLMTQLASQPGDPWIDRFLYGEYPGLRDEIRLGMNEIFGKAHQCIGSYAALLSPKTIFKASNAMNAAYAGACSELLGQERFLAPYRGSEFEELGRQLRRYNVIDRGQRGDRETADRWAQLLSLGGWFGWVTLASTMEVAQYRGP